MALDNAAHVRQTRVRYLHCVSIKILKNSRPILVATLQLKGGLNHVIFLRLGLFFLKFGGVYFNFSSYPLDFRAFSYIVFSLSNVFLSLERPLILFPIISGMFLVIDFGWLESQCMYCGMYLVPMITARHDHL